MRALLSPRPLWGRCAKRARHRQLLPRPRARVQFGGEAVEHLLPADHRDTTQAFGPHGAFPDGAVLAPDDEEERAKARRKAYVEMRAMGDGTMAQGETRRLGGQVVVQARDGIWHVEGPAEDGSSAAVPAAAAGAARPGSPLPNGEAASEA